MSKEETVRKKDYQLVALIGPDGVGKTTLVQALCMVLEDLGFESRYVRVPTEPWASVLKHVRQRGRTLSCVGYVVGVYYTARQIESWLRVSPRRIAVCDRWIGDTIASHLAQRVNPWLLRSLTMAFAVPTPGLYVLVECDLNVRRERLQQKDRIPNASDLRHLTFDGELRTLYRNHILAAGGRIIDTTQPTVEMSIREIMGLGPFR